MLKLRYLLGIALLIFAVSAWSDNLSTTPAKPAGKPKANTAQNQKKADPDKRGTKELPAIIEITKSPVIQIETTDKTKERRDYSSSEWWIVYLTGTLAAITLALAFYTGLLWRSTSKLVIEAKDTAQRELRAYLCIEAIHYFSHLDTTNNSILWSIHPVWKNGGRTPPKSLMLNVNSCVTDKPIPDDFDFPAASGETINMLVGANSIIRASQIFITGNDLAEVRKGTKFFYIWGWAKYRDIFDNTPERITRFCNHITHVGGDPTRHHDNTTNIVELVFSYYKKNNCMDEDCQQ